MRVPYDEGVAFRIDRILPDRLAVEYAEHVVGGLHRHAIDRFTRHARHVWRSHKICEPYSLLACHSLYGRLLFRYVPCFNQIAPQRS